jgi:hypothetical protein
MKRFSTAVALTVLGLTLSACDDDGPTTPSDTPAIFTATLLPANEVPPVTGAQAGGSGTVTITMNLTRDGAGNITAATADFTVTVTGFPAGMALTDAHIHPGAAGVVAGPVVNLGLSAGEVTFATGSGSFTKNGITVPVAQANPMLTNAGGFYFNIHTAANPGGVARGQLARTQ